MLLGWDEGQNDWVAIPKVRVCAILSGHPRCSKDRSKRVYTMGARSAADEEDD